VNKTVYNNLKDCCIFIAEEKLAASTHYRINWDNAQYFCTTNETQWEESFMPVPLNSANGTII